MAAYTKPKQWIKEESKRLSGERYQIKSIDQSCGASIGNVIQHS